MKTETMKDLSYYMALPYTIVLRRDSDGDVVARIEELRGCTAHGKSEAEAIDNLRDMQALWLEDCLESREPVPVPEADEEPLPSGKWVQRVPRTLHKKLVKAAKDEDVSLNQLVTSMLSEAIGTRTGTQAMAMRFGALSTWPSDTWEPNINIGGEWLLEATGERKADLVHALITAKRIVPRLAATKFLSDAYAKEIEDYTHSHR